MCRSRRHAFTLVELLVVIGIIAVLIGILLPSLNSARRQAQSVKCLSSLREIGNGFAMYASTYNNVWPCAVHDWGNPTYPLPAGRQLRWQDRILPFITNIKNVDDYKDIATLVPNDVLKSSSVLWGCPSYRSQDGQDWGNSVDEQVRNGYTMNVYTQMPVASLNSNKAYIQGPHPPFTGSLATSIQTGRYFRVNQWTKQSDRLLITEGFAYFIQMSPAVRANPTTTSGFIPSSHHWWPFRNTVPVSQWETNTYFWVDGARHAKPGVTQQATYNNAYMNALFCDGHAAPVSVKQAWQAICNPGGDNAPRWP
jgi:prepilin-type N-terminal cleavage/methylation domain-containing protein/prepilin-type processing-associated H-X9-DG protein